MPTSLFAKDIKAEARFAAFLDKTLYKPLEKIIVSPAGPVSFDRMTDMEMQMHGVDVLMCEGHHELYIDEKSQLHYINENVPTFAFELSYLKNGIVEPGWLLDSRKLTHAYMLCWPVGVKGDEFDEYRGARTFLVPKNALLTALSRLGYDRNELATRDEFMRKNNMFGPFRTKNNDFWFYFTKNCAEQMINLVVRTSFLEKIAIAAIDVSFDPEKSMSTLCGNWIQQAIHEKVSV